MTINSSFLRILIGIDDTDNLESPGSGSMAERLADGLHASGLAQCDGITRHQLFVHDNIPYTSHNSSMCIPATAITDRLDEIIAFSRSFLQQASATGSDPGLCVVVDDDRLDRNTLMDFGLDAKRTIIDKSTAYDLARNLEVHLSEHGGTGGGVIGALAATGLRLSGNDGRFRGWHHCGRAGERLSVAELCSHSFADAVATEDGQALAADQQVMLSEDSLKTVLLGGTRVIPVSAVNGVGNGPQWQTMTKKEVKRF